MSSSASIFFNAVIGKPFNHLLLTEEDAAPSVEANKKIWSAFYRAVKEEVSPKVIERAVSRYGLPFNDNNEQPLLVKHVLAIETAMADMRREDLQNAEGGFSPQCVRKQILKNLHPEKSPHKLNGSYKETTLRNLVLLDRLEMDRKRLHLYEGIEGLTTPDAFLERLAKAIISHPLEKGMLIPAPDGKGGRDYYEIVHCGGRDGLEVCALAKFTEGSQLAPIVVFQPTQVGLQKQGLFTMVNGAEPDLGASGYKASKEILEQIVKDPRFSQGDVTVTGYSLGGAHAARFVSDYPSCCSRVVFFNDPAPRDEIAKKFADAVNVESWKKPMELVFYWTVLVDRITGQRYEDCTPAFGKKHLGHGVKNPYVTVKVYNMEYVTKNTGLKKRHIKRCLDIPLNKQERINQYEIPKHEIDAKLDNTQRQGLMGWFESGRYWFVSTFIYPVLQFFSSLCQKALACFFQVLFGEDR